jgi:hypothetical protein
LRSGSGEEGARTFGVEKNALVLGLRWGDGKGERSENDDVDDTLKDEGERKCNPDLPSPERVDVDIARAMLGGPPGAAGAGGKGRG